MNRLHAKSQFELEALEPRVLLSAAVCAPGSPVGAGASHAAVITEPAQGVTPANAVPVVAQPSLPMRAIVGEMLRESDNLTAETLGEVAAYGEKKNIVINLENDAPVAEDPLFLVAVIEKLHSPYLRALPDFANSLNLGGGDELNYKAVTAMFRHVFNMCHVKTESNDKEGKRHTERAAQPHGALDRHGGIAMVIKAMAMAMCSRLAVLTTSGSSLTRRRNWLLTMR